MKRDDGTMLVIMGLAALYMVTRSPEGKVTVLDVKQVPGKGKPSTVKVQPKVGGLDEC